MVFNSVSYFLFLRLVRLCFQARPGRFRWLILLVGSVAFYASLGVKVFLLVGPRP